MLLLTSSSARRLTLTLVALLILGHAACSDPDASTPRDTSPANSGWSLNNPTPNGDPGPADQGLDASPNTPDASQPEPIDQGSSPDATSSPDMLEDVDLPTSTPDMSVSEPDMSTADMSTADMSTVDMSTVDMSTVDMSSPGGSGQDDPCGNTLECADGLLCCLSLGGQYSCTSQCFTGGICELDDDCPGQQQCCEVGGGGFTQLTCRDSCMPDPGCLNNTECSGGDVCCPSFQGPAICAPASQCQTGGRCGADADCINNQRCCGFGQFQICLNQCGF